MSSISIEINGVRGLSSNLSKYSSNLLTVGKGVASVRYNIDPRILSRRNIGARISSACSSINSLESKLQKLNIFMGNSMDKYWTAETRINQLAIQMLGTDSHNATSGESSKPWYERLFEEGVKEIKHIEKSASDEWSSFTNAFNQVSNEMKDVLVHTGESIANEIKHHGMDDLKAVGKFLWDISPMGSTVNAVKGIADYLDKHPKVMAALTIIGGAIAVVGGILVLPEILAGVATVSLATAIGSIVLGSMCIGFGTSDYLQFNGEDKEFERRKNEQKYAGMTNNEIKNSIVMDEKKSANSDFNPIRKGIRETYVKKLGNVIGEKTADDFGYNAYSFWEFTTTAVSAVFDPGVLANTFFKGAKVVDAGETMMNQIGDINRLEKADSMLNSIKSAITGKYDGVLNGDMNVFKGIRSWGQFPDRVKELKDTYSALLKTVQADKYSESTWKFLYSTSALKDTVDTIGNSYKPISFVNDIVGEINSDFAKLIHHN